MTNTKQEKQKEKPASKKCIIVLLIIAGLLFTAWLWLTPSGFWSKLNAIAYSVCHQMPDHSFAFGDLHPPLCARCTGMYLGALITIIAHFIWGKHGKFPPWWITVFLIIGLIAFAVDGVNSTLSLFSWYPKLYETTNLTRLITGLAVGLGIGSTLSVVFNQTVWINYQRSSAFEKGHRFLSIVLVLALLAAAIYSQKPVLFYPVSILTGCAIVFILWMLHCTLATFILKRSNQANSWQDLLPQGLLGLIMTFAQIGILSLARYLLTGTWLPLVL